MNHKDKKKMFNVTNKQNVKLKRYNNSCVYTDILLPISHPTGSSRGKHKDEQTSLSSCAHKKKFHIHIT